MGASSATGVLLTAAPPVTATATGAVLTVATPVAATATGVRLTTAVPVAATATGVRLMAVDPMPATGWGLRATRNGRPVRLYMSTPAGLRTPKIRLFRHISQELTIPYTPLVAPQPQVSYATLDDAIAGLGLPSRTDASYVMWDDAWDTIDRAHDALAAAGASPETILVLPERPGGYELDMSRGFRAPASAAVSVDTWPMYQPSATSREWFAVTRGFRGIVGLGPGAVVHLTNPGGWSAPRQPAEGIWSYTDQAGAKHYPSDANANILQFDHPDVVVANVVFGPAPEMGGVAFGCINSVKGQAGQRLAVKRVSMRGSWSGFFGGPNGESFGIGQVGGTYLVEDCWLDGRRLDGTVSGTSPIGINKATGGAIRRTACISPWKGMATIWASTGTHLIEDCLLVGAEQQQLNVEACAGITVDVNRGYIGHGTRSPIHIGIGAYKGDAKVTFRDTAFDLANSPRAGQIFVDCYTDGTGAWLQQAASVTAVDSSGTPVPVYVNGGL